MTAPVRALEEHSRARFVCARTLALVVVFATSLGCGTVRPYERELLADPSMVFGEEPTDAHLDHAITYREGAGGARGVSGGGCGCN